MYNFESAESYCKFIDLSLNEIANCMNSFMFNWSALLHFQAKRRKRQHHSCYNPPALSLLSAATWVKQGGRDQASLSATPVETRPVGPREKSFLKTKATSLYDGVSCLQRDQSYVVGGIYILRGSMELRESLGTPPLFGILPFVCHRLFCSPSLASA